MSKLPDLSSSLSAAQSLLGWELVHATPEGIVAGYIVETESYAANDPASHSYRGLRVRNAPMFEPAGTIYVYFTYGMHFCMNIVTGEKGVGEAVLIRALQPTQGLSLMKAARGHDVVANLTNGPAKLTQAMMINAAHNGTRIGKQIYLKPGITPRKIITTKRVGISRAADAPARFYIAGNSFVSKR